MIKKITIRGVASYDNEGVVFDDLQRVNFIYGGNGTGKTTISRELNSYKIKEGYGDHCKLEWDDEPGEVLAYNKDFKEHFLQENMPGVFTFERRYETKGMSSYGFTVDRTIECINKTLEEIGYTGFSIQPSPTIRNHYQIQRPGGQFVKSSLSEGEVTFITFLYFMQMIKGNTADLSYKTPKVVVIDDPISSLDVEAMYVVSEKIKELIEEINSKSGKRKTDINKLEQIIVLTHNTAFQKIASWHQSGKNTRYWILKKKMGVTVAKFYGTTNPVRGIYEQLWQELREGKDNMSCVTIHNTMRRILEAYFVGFGGYDKKKLFAGEYADTPEDELIIASLSKWFDEGSHGAMDDVFAGDAGSLTDHYMNVFERLFEKLGHAGHYKMMMREE